MELLLAAAQAATSWPDAIVAIAGMLVMAFCVWLVRR